MVATRDELKAVIVEDLARSDVTSASPQLDRYITLVEADLNRVLRVEKMEKIVSLPTTGGVSTVDLPSDYIKVQNVELSDAPKQLDYVSRHDFSLTYSGVSSGRPRKVTTINNTVEQLLLGPTPDGVYNINLSYYAKVPALSDTVTTNFVLQRYPQLYIDGCLYYAFRRLRNTELALGYRTEFDSRIKTLNVEENSDIPQGSRMRVVGRSV